MGESGRGRTSDAARGRCDAAVIALAIQAVVFLCLLVYSWLMRAAQPSLSNLVVGAGLYHFFRESTYAARRASQGATRRDDGD